MTVNLKSKAGNFDGDRVVTGDSEMKAPTYIITLIHTSNPPTSGKNTTSRTNERTNDDARPQQVVSVSVSLSLSLSLCRQSHSRGQQFLFTSAYPATVLYYSYCTIVNRTILSPSYLVLSPINKITEVNVTVNVAVAVI